MADEFDGCECVWSHEFAMQRLLAFIRQSQDHCTDTECIDVSGRVQPQHSSRSTGDEATYFSMMTIFMILAVIMYFIRPESILKLTGSKPSRRQNPHGDAPPPPPAPPAVN